jgi:hypothetical protein
MSSSQRNGPLKIISYSCAGCQYLKEEYYAAEDGNDYDWGYTRSCKYVSEAEGDLGYDQTTPYWCPLLPKD